MALSDIFSKFLGNQAPSDTLSARAAPGTSIHYHPELIDKLTNDHKILIAIYTRIHKSIDAGDVQSAVAYLNKFKAVLQEHLLLENVKLYVYLSHQLAADESKSDTILGFRREMGKIGGVVMDFLRTYTEQPLDASRLDEFKQELTGIGAALTDRIEREERDLYTLYTPIPAVK
ncbi:MAG: hemerythrin domain-containing protein [Proteobacteria bacterium]|nr:hemerythrin domain-containing protein [Pseudomonadota bacterium]